MAPHLQRKRYNNLLYLRSVNEEKQAPPLPQRPGYQDAKKAVGDMHKQVRQDCAVHLIPKIERQRLQNQLDPSMQRYLEWPSTDTKFILVDLVLLDFGLASTRMERQCVA